MPTNKAIRVIYFFKFVHFIRFKVTELFVFEIYTFLKVIVLSQNVVFCFYLIHFKSQINDLAVLVISNELS